MIYLSNFKNIFLNCFIFGLSKKKKVRILLKKEINKYIQYHSRFINDKNGNLQNVYF